MPKENKKRGRREEKKKKRKWEEEDIEEGGEENIAHGSIKRQKSQDEEEQPQYIPLAHDMETQEAYTADTGLGDLPFYGLLDEEEQEYFKRADSMLELNQFGDAEERELFLANVYKEANGKELKLANSQSCSRLMERLIQLSTAEQLKTLFQKFNGQFLHLVQHRFASHCCEALFLQAAPIVGHELKAGPPEAAKNASNSDVFVSTENLFLYTVDELEGNLGYLMTDQFASHPLRVLLVVLSGMSLSTPYILAVLQSRKKEKVSVSSHTTATVEGGRTRTVPGSFLVAVDKMISSTIAGLDTSTLRALATQPLANPVLQLLLEVELKRSGKQSAKNPQSLFRTLLPDDPPVEGTESAAFINHMLYDTIGSRLLEFIVTHAPGKTFKSLYRTSLKDKLGTLAKNEIAAFVVIKILERLGKEDLESAVEQLSPHVGILIERSRTSVIKALIERCRARELDTQPIADALQQAYSSDASNILPELLNLSLTTPDDTNTSMSADRKKALESQGPSKVHRSLLAQSMLDAPGPLRDLITSSLLAIPDTTLLNIAKDRTASRILQNSLTCASQSPKFRRLFIPRFYPHIADLALDTVASHLIDAFWAGSAGLVFIRERIASELAKSEVRLRESLPGRAVWRNWKMDVWKAKRGDWLGEAKGIGRDGRVEGKTGIELARERHAMASRGGRGGGRGMDRVKGRVGLVRGEA